MSFVPSQRQLNNNSNNWPRGNIKGKKVDSIATLKITVQT